MKRYLLIILTLLFLFTACSENTSINNGSENEMIIKAIEKIPDEISEYTVYDECKFDLNSDKNVEKITLYTDAKTDKDGLIENDSNKWALVVSDILNSKYYVLFNDNIRHGDVRFQVADYLRDGEVISNIVFYHSSSAKIEINKFHLNNSGEFIGKKLYDSNTETKNGINLKYSSK